MKSSVPPLAVPSSVVKTLSIVFVDITGFTKFSMSHSLEDLLRLIKRYMEITDIVISPFEYEILEFTGDEILAGFENPMDAYNFVKNFRSEVKSALKEFGLDVRTGVHSGELLFLKVSSHVGVKTRKVIGPVVNICKKIQTAATLRIHISDSFRSALVKQSVNETFLPEEPVYGEKTWSIEE